MSAINNIVKNNVTYQVQDARVDSMTGVFEATYNETSFSDVVAKYNLGWTIICNKGSHELHMVDYSAGTFSFAATLGSSDLSTLQYEVAKLNSQGWSANNENVQNKLVAGSNIAISGNVISATGGASYTAGNGINIANNVVSAKYATDLTVDANGNLKSIYGGASGVTYDYDKRNLDVTPTASDEEYPFDDWRKFDCSSAFTAQEIIDWFDNVTASGRQSPMPQLIIKLTTNDGDYEIRCSNCDSYTEFVENHKFKWGGNAQNDRGECWVIGEVVDNTPVLKVYINDGTAVSNQWHLNRVNLYAPNAVVPINTFFINKNQFANKFDDIYSNLYGLSDRFYNNIWEKGEGTYVLKCTVDSEGERTFEWVAES